MDDGHEPSSRFSQRHHPRLLEEVEMRLMYHAGGPSETPESG
jgi:hypothetical protein